MALTGDNNKIQDVHSQVSGVQACFPSNVSELLWEDKDRTLRELIATFRLPLFVKLKTGDISSYIVNNVSGNNETKFSGNSQASNPSVCDTSATARSSSTYPSNGVDSKKTPVALSGQSDVVLQIHETRRKKIIQARKMTWEKRQNDYVVSGEQVEIPASYKGWFEVVPDDGRPVEYFESIGGISSVKPRRFLVRTSIVGYHLSAEENGSSCWMPYEIKTGDVLTTGIIHTDTKKTRTPPNRNILKRLLKQSKGKKEQDLKYLQCFDSNGWEIMIPFIMSGVFSPVGDSTVANLDAVYELQDLIIAFGLPVNTQLIHANNKDGFHCPRGVIRLYGTREEELAIVSKIGPDGILFRENAHCEKFEIPLDHMLFSRGVVKRKPVIKSKLVEGISHPYGKITTKCKSEECEIKDKEYVTAKMMEDFRVRVTNDKTMAAQATDKSNYMSISSMNKIALRHEDKKEISFNKTNNEMSLVSNDSQSTSFSTVLSDSNTQSCLVDESSRYSDSHQLKCPEPNNKNEVELPERVPKELKKSRSTSILDKLSVRKVKKERAKLKELRGDDVFSKRITRSELSYQEFFNGLDNDEEKPKSGEAPKSDQDDSGRGCSNGTYQSSSSCSSVPCSTSTPNTLSKASSKVATDTAKSIHRRESIQKRGLPPIPLDAESSSPKKDISTESLYEHLPPAPQPPHYRRASDSVLLDDKCDDSSVDTDENSEDGYMVPLQVQQEARYTKRSDANVLNKQLEQTKDSIRSRRPRKSRGELPPEFVSRGYGYDESRSLDTDDLFNLAYTSTKYGESHPLYSLGGPSAVSTSQIYGTYKMPSRRLDLTRSTGNFGQRFEDELDFETANSKRGLRQSSGFSKHVNANRKAAARSHSLRKAVPSENKSLNQTGSFLGIREGNSLPTFYDFPNMQEAHIQSPFIDNPHRQMLTSRSIDAAMMSQHLQQYQQQMNFYSRDYGVAYAASEPTFCQNNRAVSLSGISDVLLKQGDDSAISMCSRGEAGYPNESEYSYKEQVRQEDDGWTPPEKLEGLSVQEVSKSLRYIGMKDRIILRFSKEQIDGSMLCSLDKKLLIEGFPELNALEIKKILDFVQGWRPKKT